MWYGKYVVGEKSEWNTINLESKNNLLCILQKAEL